MSRIETVRLTRNEIGRASEILAKAFFNYPMFVCYFPDPMRRSRYLAWYLRNVLNCAFRHGEAYTTREISGAIFTLPPGHTRFSIREYVRNGFLLTPFALGFRNYIRSMECEDFVGQTQEDVMRHRPHTYLWGLAADPAYQSTGIGPR